MLDFPCSYNAETLFTMRNFAHLHLLCTGDVSICVQRVYTLIANIIIFRPFNIVLDVSNVVRLLFFNRKLKILFFFGVFGLYEMLEKKMYQFSCFARVFGFICFFPGIVKVTKNPFYFDERKNFISL